jgi:DNA-binding GntR family transcriptional regulator
MLDIVETHHRMTFATLNGEAAQIACEAADTWHGPLIDLIESGDVDAAVAHWERHLRRAAKLALEHLGPGTVIDLLERST